MKSKLTWLEVLLLLAPFVALAILWSALPARVPVHWNLQNEIDRYDSKAAGLLLLPLINVALVALLYVLPRFDPKLRKRAGDESRLTNVLAVVRMSTAAFLDVICATQICAALGYAVPVGRIVASACLLLFAVLGNYLTAVPPNYFIGIRTPWTLENADTWRATHRLGGRLMFFGAIALLVAQFFLPEMLFTLILVGGVIALAVWSFWYSWHNFQTQKRAT